MVAEVKKKVAKKAPAAHPKYLDMVVGAIRGLKDTKGSSKHAIVKYIMSNYKVGDNDKHINTRVKLALKSGATEGVLKQVKGTGASGSFRVTDKSKKEPTKKASPKKKPTSPKKSPAKKTDLKKKTTSVKKTPTKKSTTKKASPTKKTPVKKVTKKASPAKKAAKSPKKTAAKKKAKK
uniref:Histone H1-delta n=1 Tax=Caligus rogercresseyi TaxID=217165 RepID=C1BMK4_CALRO|nr:Histone H1-delta [Caligus rogercresseyi]